MFTQHQLPHACGWVVGRTSNLPIILVLGPPGSGKGTLCKQLAADFSLHHLSVGDWLRAQTAPPIAGVPDHINLYVEAGEAVPEAVMNAEYGDIDHAPAPLILYNCSKRNVSTPESMKCRLMPTLKDAIRCLSKRTFADGCCRSCDPPKGILLDNLLSTRAHAEAAAEMFGANFPTMAISVECSDGTAGERFLGRGRGNDDTERFVRRIARYRAGHADVVAFLRDRNTSVVEVNTEGEPEAVYEHVLDVLATNKDWMRLTADEESEGLEQDIPEPLNCAQPEVSVQS